MPSVTHQTSRSTRKRRPLTYRGVTLQRPAAAPQTPVEVLEAAVRRAIEKNGAMLRALAEVD